MWSKNLVINSPDCYAYFTLWRGCNCFEQPRHKSLETLKLIIRGGRRKCWGYIYKIFSFSGCGGVWATCGGLCWHGTLSPDSIVGLIKPFLTSLPSPRASHNKNNLHSCRRRLADRRVFWYFLSLVISHISS